MAVRSLLTSLIRRQSTLVVLEQHQKQKTSSLLSRPISSTPTSLVTEEEDISNPNNKDDDLRSRIFRLRFPKRSATNTLQKWVAEGNKVTVSQLRNLAKDLNKSQRYKHALEILSWMEAQNKSRMSPSDHAIRLELITKVGDFAEAEDYFENLPNTTSQKAAGYALLHSFVKERATKKAEALMLKLQNLGLAVNPHLFNEIMKLYIATGQFEKVILVIRQMKQNRIPCNVLSYNLGMNACHETSGVAAAEKVFEELVNDKSVEVGWSSHCTIANIYLRSGLFDQALSAVKTAELKISKHKRLAHFFLITLYAKLNDKDGVIRLWEASKDMAGRITCSNYMCILSCLVKVGDIGEAEKVFRSWESECGKYDVRVSNVLLGAYVRSGCMGKAESLHQHVMERGGCPNYKTWEILMEGWVKSKEMDKAIIAMKKGFSMLKHCDWRPSPTIAMKIAEYFEEQGNLEDAKKYFKVLRRLDVASLALYKSLLRLHVQAQEPAPAILKMMAVDKIDLDEEASALVRCLEEMKTNTVKT